MVLTLSYGSTTVHNICQYFKGFEFSDIWILNDKSLYSHYLLHSTNSYMEERIVNTASNSNLWQTDFGWVLIQGR